MKEHKRHRIKLWAVRVILIALIVLWMSTIFGFSAESGEQSQSLSDKITIRVVNILNADYDNMSIAQQREYFNTISFFVRKTGHFGEYAILGILMVTFIMTFETIRNLRRIGMLPILITTLVGMIYAATDEIHQLFVPGRACMVTDVMIDSAGALTGILFASALAAIIIGRNRE